MKIPVPPDLLALARRFAATGFRLYAVGGFVRARILGAPDGGEIDCATDATPGEARAFCRVVGDAGARYGTLVLREGDSLFECTTFRRDVGAGDGRRPDSVEFVRDLAADAARRDFTMNAAYLDPLTGELADPFRGADDLRAGRIRFVGDADARLREDSLRALRYVRFSARYGLAQDPAERAAVAAAMPGAARSLTASVQAREWAKLPDAALAPAARALEASGYFRSVADKAARSPELAFQIARMAERL